MWRLSYWVLRLALLILLLLGGLVWLAGREPVLQWAAQEVERMSGGDIAVRGVRGSLYGPLSFESATLLTEGTRFELKDLNLDWSPLALLRRQVQIDEATLQEMQVIGLKTSETLPVLPDALRLPVSLSMPRVRVNRMVLKTGKAEQVLSELVGALEKPDDTYRLVVSTLTTPWGRAQAQATVSDERPFIVAGSAKIQLEASTWPYQAQATVSGTLARLVFKGDAASRGTRVDVDATFTPFEKQWVEGARVQAGGIDPARLRPGLPRAEISALVTLASQGEEGFVGEISTENALPGAWDQARLPIRAWSSRFTSTGAQMELRDIRLDLAQAGLFLGQGRAEGGRLDLRLNTRNFDPRGVLGTMQSVKLNGDIRLQADATTQNLAADLHYQQYQLRLDVAHHDDTLEIKEAVVRSGSSRLSLYGQLSLATARRFQLAGALAGFNPAAFGDYPAASVNASFTGSGHLDPEPEMTLRFAVSDSRFRGQPLSGQGDLSLSENRFWDADVLLQLARNRLQARGSLGRPGDQLAFTLEANHLTVLDPDLAGRVNATGTLAGRFSELSGAFNLEAEGLRWRKTHRLGSLQASGRLDKGLEGLLALDASARNIATPQTSLDSARLVGRGQRAQHVLAFEAKNPKVDLEGRLAGGWREEAGWSGLVRSLSNQGRHPFKLLGPAQLEMAPDRFRLADAQVDVAGASITVHEAAYKNGHISSRGELRGLAAAYLQQLAAEPVDLKTDLTLDGEWRFDASDKVNGRIALWRAQGDVSLPTVPATRLGLSRLALNVEATDNVLRATLDAVGAPLGSLQAEVQTVLSQKEDAWGIAGDTAWQASADLAVNSLAWAAPLIDPTRQLIVDGALKVQMRGSGSVAEPRLTGTVEGERFKLEVPDQGMHFRDGRFLAELQGDVLQLTRLSWQAGEGRLTGQGRLAIKSGVPDMQLALTADKLEVVSRPDRHLILSGTADTSLTDKQVQVAARFKADRGLIELPKGDVPSASDDVIVLGREAQAVRKGLPLALRLDLGFDLGEQFFLRGQGLDAQLGGAVKLVSEDGSLPRTSGSIRIVKGAYSAYGQRLVIERGILNFQGPVDNPGLNIIAMRKNQDVEAGVAITGSAQAPLVKLVSTPTVPDSEKLSWLVLGHGVESSSGQDFSALQTAAGALLAAGDSVTLQQRIAYAAGLEEVSLRGAGTVESTVLTLGKRLSSRAYLSYEHGLSGADTLAKINYTLTKRLSVRAQAGTAPAVDLFYTFSYD